MSKGEYVCYVLLSEDGRKTYAGCTNHLARRLRQHRRQIRGGARATAAFGPRAALFFVVSGFGGDKCSALKFEWRLKQHRNWYRSLPGPGPQRRRALLSHALRWARTALPDVRPEVHWGGP